MPRIKAAMEVFKTAQYFSSLKVAELQPTAADLDALLSLTFLKRNDITSVYPCRSRGIPRMCSHARKYENYAGLSRVRNIG